MQLVKLRKTISLTNENHSWSHGAEGPVDGAGIVAPRERQNRDLLATLLFSHRGPMICGGDELGRTQQGNNKAYCQDDEVSRYDWELDRRRRRLETWYGDCQTN